MANGTEKMCYEGSLFVNARRSTRKGDQSKTEFSGEICHEGSNCIVRVFVADR